MIFDVGLYRFQLRWIPVLVTLVVFTVCLRLGWWQLARAAEKAERLAQIAHYQTFNRVSFSDLITFQQTIEPTGIEVEVSGTFHSTLRWMLDNKVVAGQPGYDILAAFKPLQSDQWLVVNMGWIKGDYANRQQLPEFTLPTEIVKLNGFVKAKELDNFALSHESSNQATGPQRIQQINLQNMQQQSQLSFYPFIIMVQNAQSFGFTYHYQPVVMSPEKHQAYAAQWFLLAIAAVIVFLFASQHKLANPINEEHHK